MDCFALEREKGCKALNYDSKDIENGCCQNCKFYKTQQQHMIDKYAEPSGIERLLLIIDKAGQGIYKSIKDIDDKLRQYYEEHKEEEDMNAKKDSLFIGDFNLMYENHDIQIIRM